MELGVEPNQEHSFSETSNQLNSTQLLIDFSTSDISSIIILSFFEEGN